MEESIAELADIIIERKKIEIDRDELISRLKLVFDEELT